MYKRIVVKIGTKVIADEGGLSESALRRIVDQVATLRKKGVDVAVVTSGAVATGKRLAMFEGTPGSLGERQVYAAVGQVRLMSRYQEFFETHGYRCAQLLVTKGDFRDRSHYANMRDWLENLLKSGVIPVVNENDTISTSKVAFADNDELAGVIASQLNADAVIFLTSVDGVLVRGEEGKEEVVPEIREEDIPKFEREISDKKSAGGYGGMRNKFRIARTLMRQGITVHIGNGARPDMLVALVEGKPAGTTFVPTKKLSAVKRRLAYSDGLSSGAAYVDEGAAHALLSKDPRSLLPVGVIKLEGDFKKGDVIEIRGSDGKKLGFGIAQYGAEEATPLLGKKHAPALVHYNYMTLVD